MGILALPLLIEPLVKGNAFDRFRAVGTERAAALPIRQHDLAHIASGELTRATYAHKRRHHVGRAGGHLAPCICADKRTDASLMTSFLDRSVSHKGDGRTDSPNAAAERALARDSFSRLRQSQN